MRELTTICDAECMKETASALLVLVDGDPFWIPKSVIDDDSEVSVAGDKGDLIIATWFAEREGIG
jgi:hypothetical protein